MDDLALLCAELPVLKRLADQAGLADDFAEVVDAAARGGLSANAVTDLLRRLGIPHASARRDVPDLPGLVGGHTAGEIYECPTASCTRIWVRGPGLQIPICAIYNQTMRRQPV